MNDKPIPSRELLQLIQARLFKNETGQICTDSPLEYYSSWIPYLEVFDTVVIFARIDPKVRPGVEVEGPGVHVIEIPYYLGPFGYILRYLRIRRAVRRLVSSWSGYVAVRMPNPLGKLMQESASRRQLPFLTQAVGDPEDVLRSGALGRIGKLATTRAKKEMQSVVNASGAVTYVTLETLQRKYPAQPSSLVLARSDVKLSAESFGPKHRDYSVKPVSSPPSIMAVGSQQRRYKGHDVLLHAIHLLVQEGFDTRLVLIGEGQFHAELVQQASTLGVSDNVTFLPQVGGPEDLRRYFGVTDLFVMPSRTEGLPRVLVEAMASGIACLGTRVGGIPELLDARALVAPDDAEGLADRIKQVLLAPQVMTSLAEKQFSVANRIWKENSGDEMLRTFLTEWVLENES